MHHISPFICVDFVILVLCAHQPSEASREKVISLTVFFLFLVTNSRGFATFKSVILDSSFCLSPIIASQPVFGHFACFTAWADCSFALSDSQRFPFAELTSASHQGLQNNRH